MDKIHVSIFNQLNYLLNRYSSWFALSKAEWKFSPQDVHLNMKRGHYRNSDSIHMNTGETVSVIIIHVSFISITTSYRIIQIVVTYIAYVNIAYIGFRL